MLLSQIELLGEDQQADSAALFPADVYDVDMQQVDKARTALSLVFPFVFLTVSF